MPKHTLETRLPAICNGGLLSVGQRDRYKRFDLALQAVHRQPGLSLGIVGPRLSEAERVALRSNLDLRWQEFGPVDQRTLRGLSPSAFAFVFPSDYGGFGMPLLETMACGCPVVAANNSSLPEVGRDGALYAIEQHADAMRNNSHGWRMQRCARL
jgi:mannosyltransferase